MALSLGKLGTIFEAKPQETKGESEVGFSPLDARYPEIDYREQVKSGKPGAVLRVEAGKAEGIADHLEALAYKIGSRGSERG